MRLSDLSDTLTADIQDLLKSAGYGLVRAKKMGGQRHPTLQIMMDRLDGAPITVEDCEAVNRLLDPLFSVHDPWPEPYQLEVSSPGLDRPLILPQDFVRFVGQRVKVRLSPPHRRPPQVRGGFGPPNHARGHCRASGRSNPVARAL